LTLLINKWTNVVMNDGWVHPLAKTLPSLVSNLWWKIVLDDGNMDENSFGKWQSLQQYKPIIPPNKIKIKLQGMTNNVGSTFSVGDATMRFSIGIEQENHNCYH
jgi:hypothetical protein